MVRQVTSAIFVVLSTTTLSGESVHLKGESNAEPAFRAPGLLLFGSQSIPSTQIKNGNVPLNVTTKAPVTPILGAPDCRNPNGRKTLQIYRLRMPRWSRVVSPFSPSAALSSPQRQLAQFVAMTVSCTSS
jgi:hypothetical protein